MIRVRRWFATWVDRASHSRFVRAFGLLSAATALGQIVGLFSIPLLARNYSPTEFGEYGVFIALGAALSVFACLRLDQAIPRANRGHESDSIASAGFISAALVSSLLLLLFLVTGPIPGIELCHVGLLLLPLSVFLGALWLLVVQLAIRRGQFRMVAVRSVLQPVVTFAVQGVLILVHTPGPGLIVGYILGQAAAALLFYSDIRQALAQGLRRFWPTVQSHRRYILIMTPQGLLNALNIQLPLLMMSWLYSAETTGFFSMTQRVMGVPVGLIGITMGQVYVSFLSQRMAKSPEGVAELFARVSTALLFVGLALIVGSVLFAPPLFELVLGQQWHQSARFAQVASIMYAAQLVAAPLAVTLVVMRQEAVQASWDLWRTGILLGSFFCAWRFDLSPSVFLIVLTVVVSTAYTALWLLCRRSVTFAMRVLDR